MLFNREFRKREIGKKLKKGDEGSPTKLKESSPTVRQTYVESTAPPVI